MVNIHIIPSSIEEKVILYSGFFKYKTAFIIYIVQPSCTLLKGALRKLEILL